MVFSRFEPSCHWYFFTNQHSDLNQSKKKGRHVFSRTAHYQFRSVYLLSHDQCPPSVERGGDGLQLRTLKPEGHRSRFEKHLFNVRVCIPADMSKLSVPFRRSRLFCPPSSYYPVISFATYSNSALTPSDSVGNEYRWGTRVRH